MAGILKVDKYQDFNGNDIMTSDGSGNITLSSNMTTAVQSAGSANTPAFFVHNNASQSLTSSTFTEVTFQTEVVDTDNAFASNTFTVPSGKGGNYLIGSNLEFRTNADNLRGIINNIYVNGSMYMKQNNEYESSYPAKANLTVVSVIPLSAGDTVNIYAYLTWQGTEGIVFHEGKTTHFYGYRLIG
ncbi:hypothetical protein N9349_04275 [Candidatus Pelagibacter sp.]|nr:hypothetical protein [Candidatus Pelagibacter sp.]